MAKFLFNGPCPKCGSRDNLANYSDGSKWCWGCRYYQSPNISPYVTEKLDGIRSADVVSKSVLEGFTTDLSEETTKWLHRYEISPYQARQHGILSNPSRNQTVFLFSSKGAGRSDYDDAETISRDEESTGTSHWGLRVPVPRDDEILGYQARNHNPNSKQRYYTSGKVEELLPIYFHTEGYTKTLVLVEDCLSAIKISTITDAMPILGSDLSNKKLSRLRPFYGHLKVWLDSDMLHKARTIKNRAEAIGITADVIYTPKDPKEYSYAEIREYLGQEVL